MMRLALLVAAGASTASPGAPLSHDDEISAFASTMAIVRTSSENCRGTEVNETYLEGLRQRLHVEDRDHPIFAERARDVVGHLREGIAQAPSPEAWCDSVYALYGPQGTMIPKLLRRR